MSGPSALFDDLPPEARRQVLAIAKAQGIHVPAAPCRRRSHQVALEASCVPPAGSHGVEAPPEVREWPLRRHGRCGWEGVGLCAFCGK